MLFPHKKIRNIQKEMIEAINYALKKKKKKIIHAPTGIGKTAASLSPALSYALENNLTVFFLTSRHTQHKIAVDTLKKIKEEFSVADIIGKKGMCLQNVEYLYSSEFNEYCKSIREKDECEFYNNVKKKNKVTAEANLLLDDLKKNISHAEELIEKCRKNKLCPYEAAMLLAKKSKVIIADYYYIFNPSIRNIFLNKIDKKIEECILIIDEGHNLANRARELMTFKLSNFTIRNAIKEAKKYNQSVIEHLSYLQDMLNELSYGLAKEQEKKIKKEEVINYLNKIKDYNELVAELNLAGEEIRIKKKKSYIGSIANFLEAWQNQDEGFSRILYFNEELSFISLRYSCLDPSLITREVIEKSYSSILMSGTLMPTEMYKNLLGFPEDSLNEEFESPFPAGNRLNLIVDEVTTKFTERNDREYEKIAQICSSIFNSIRGNTAFFFPSYILRDSVYNILKNNSKDKMILEKPKLNKTDKEKLLEEFKKYKKKGAMLLGVTSGSFGEGIDLPGDLLKCVVVVGLPLSKPDLETKELIKYYNQKFEKGIEYGYIMPAITKAMQNAGRCIRSETDKGVIVFMDKRYTWPIYNKYFPKDWNIKVSRDYVKDIKDFIG